MRNPLTVCIMLLAGLWLAGCAGDRRAVADRLATGAGLQPVSIETGIHRIQAWRRLAAPEQPATVYIEGDGLAWLDRHRPSRDPTPLNPVGLALASRDTAANVIYLARPCMYGVDDSRCSIPVWTERQFDEPAVAALDRALDQLKQPGQRLHLVGYSGGAAMAAALAARRGDVASLRSVAGNLDPAAVNRFHNVTPLPAAIDVAALAPRLARLPQLHFTGTGDRIVPGTIATQFSRAAGPCAAVVSVQADHARGWEEAWPRLLQMPLPCSSN
jgi:pimeloyl-ACP methyl ester carboxylesterase